MPDTTRTFVAIPMPTERAAALGRLQSRLAPDLPGTRWTPFEHFHLTLAFLGDVGNTELNAVCRAVAEASAPFTPLELRLEGVGCFPDPKRPRVVWAGLRGEGVEPLAALQRELAAALKRIGYPPDGKFSPHITLGRFKSARGPVPDATAVVAQNRGWDGGPLVAREVVTFASRLLPEGPEYTALARAPLGGGNGSSPA